MTEKEILEKRLKEIEEQLSALEAPSEEMQQIIDEMFRKLETRMEQIDATGKTLSDDIDMYKEQFVQYVEELYKKTQERSSHRAEVDYANKSLEKGNTDSAKFHIEEIPNSLANDPYTSHLTNLMVEYFGDVGKQLKIKYAPDLTEFMRGRYGFGTLGSSRDARRAEDMDSIIRKLEREYDEQILKTLKSDKMISVDKIEEIIQKLELELMINNKKEKQSVSSENILGMISSSGATVSSVNQENDRIKELVERFQRNASRLPNVKDGNNTNVKTDKYERSAGQLPEEGSSVSRLKEILSQLPKARYNDDEKR